VEYITEKHKTKAACLEQTAFIKITIRNTNLMETKHKQKIAELLDEKIRQAGSQNKLARQSDINPAVLSFIRNNKWDAVSEPSWMAVANYIGYKIGDEQPGAELKWVTFGTPNFKVIQNRCADAQKYCQFQGIDGATGYGKTVALKYYAEKNENAYYLLCKASMNAKEFLKELCRVLDIETEGSKYVLETAIGKKLVGTGNAVMIFDDAGKLNDTCYNYLISICDNVIGFAGLVIAGVPEELKNYITRMAVKGKKGFSQLRRRVRDWQPLVAPNNAVIGAMLKEMGIVTDAAKYEGDKALVSYVCNTAANYGDISNLIISAARTNGGLVTLDTLQKVNTRNL
jgi:DNA transposition AAA+ family ATPase